jgi:hypothetical protein
MEAMDAAVSGKNFKPESLLRYKKLNSEAKRWGQNILRSFSLY